MIVIVGVNVFF